MGLKLTPNSISVTIISFVKIKKTKKEKVRKHTLKITLVGFVKPETSLENRSRHLVQHVPLGRLVHRPRHAQRVSLEESCCADIVHMTRHPQRVIPEVSRLTYRGIGTRHP